MRKHFPFTSIVVLLFLIPSNVFCQEVFTLEQCREMALANNKQSQIASKTAEQYAYTAKAYFANYLPNISATSIYGYSTGSFDYSITGGMLPTFVPSMGADGSISITPNILTSGGVPVTDANGNYVYNAYAFFPDIDFNLKTGSMFYGGVQLEQPIFMGGKITAAYRMATLGKEIAETNVILTSGEVIVNADEAFWTCVKVNELLKTAEKYKEVVAELYRMVNNAYEGGMASMNDLLKVKVKVNEAELNLQKAKNGVKLATMNLCHLIGLPLNEAITVAGSFEEEPTALTDMNDDVTIRPEYEILTKQIELKQNESLLTKSDFLPNIGATASYGYLNGLKLNDERLLDKTSLLAMVSVSIPIFHWGEGANKVRASEVERQLIEIQRDEAVEMMTLEVTQALNKYEESILEVSMNKEALEQADENLRVSKDQYEAGLETLAGYMEAQTIWQQSRSNYIESQASLKLSHTKYLKAAGLLNIETEEE